MKILRNYVLKEMIAPFILSISVFTFVLLMGNIIKLADLIINKGVDIVSVGKMFLALIPYLLNYTIPMAILTATLLAFGRLSSDNEIVAMKASGVSLYRIAVPIIIVGLIFSLFGIYLNDRVLPRAHYESRKILKSIGIKRPAAYLEAGTFIKTFQNYIIFIYGIKNNILQNIRIYQPQADGPTRTIVANRGEFISIPEKNIVRLKLVDGTSDEPNPKNPKQFYKLNFKTYYITLDLSEELKAQEIGKKPKDMNIAEIRDEIVKLEEEGIPVTPLYTEIYKKISFSFSSLVFVLLGLPLAIMVRRGEKSVGFGLSLAIIILYYILFALAEALSLKGIVNPAIGMWLPNIIFISAGIFLIRFSIER
ncbi:MAG: hypothetical protein AUJ75_00390 [Candidatus Omnitrophica bacterium CG1_02_49_10]|nr:MAG: hypothetical protein AUJ75_00390 [Candidatus Omnitrophica bacterium CG1_02_49_10]